MAYFTPAERDERIADAQTIFSKAISPEDQMLLLNKYDIRFLILDRGDLDLFNDLIANYPDQVTATEIEWIYLIQIY